MATQPDFIIIDDEVVNNVLCKYQILRVHAEAQVNIFTYPQEGLNYLKELIHKPVKNKTILFLDINMPEMSGWDLIKELEGSGQIPRETLFIYVLSSSINPIDQELTKSNPNVVGFFSKPLTVEIVQSIKG
jgi:CheY-like chemotaxis protein